MKRVLYILGQLADEYVDWLIQNGKRERVTSKTELIQQGRKVDKIYLVLHGNFVALLGGRNGRELARLGVGDVMGELSFLDARPPVASVVADGDASVLALDKKRLEAKLASDPQFAARFYRALGQFLATRLRKQTTLLGAATLDDEDDSDNLEDIEIAGARFDFLMKRLQQL